MHSLGISQRLAMVTQEGQFDSGALSQNPGCKRAVSPLQSAAAKGRQQRWSWRPHRRKGSYGRPFRF